MHNNFIKPPALSTSFSHNGKSLRSRLENIFAKSKKKGIYTAAAVILTAVSASALVACGSNDAASIGIIGGADGPTAVYISEENSDNIKQLYDAKTKYIGDISGVGKIIRLTPFAENIKFAGTELQTSKEPYGITLYYIKDESTADDTDFQNTAAVMIALTDNCFSVTFKDNDANESITFTRDTFNSMLEKPLSEYVSSLESFSEFMTLLSAGSIQNKQADTDTPISLAILAQSENYSGGECAAEGHIILGNESEVILDNEQRDGNKIYYLLVSYGSYGFENGNFIKVAGSGVIPTRITFDGQGNLLEYKQPSDGAGYEKSIKEIFPSAYWDRILDNDKYDEYYSLLKAQEHAYAKAYLSSINHKECEIGEYADFEHTLPDMNADASNLLGELYSEYPYWIGTLERVEEGIRYVYEFSWESKGGGNGIATYKKYSYHSGTDVDEAIIEVNGSNLTYIKGIERTGRQ